MSAQSISTGYRLWLQVRSVIFWVWLLVYTALFAIPALLGTLVSFEFAYRICKVWIAGIILGLKVICGVDWEVKGAENVPDKACLILSKHQSTWETFFLAHHLKHVLFVAKRSLSFIPVFGWMIKLLGFVMIDRKAGHSAIMQMTEQSRALVAKNRWIVVFPEGTRMPVGAEPNYRIGGMKVSADTQIPILPVAVNSGEFWPRMGFIKWPGTVTVVFGPLIHPENKTPDEIREEVQSWIESQMQTITVKDRFPY